MNTVERVKTICKERKIPISKLERDLNFGNAYISGLKKGSIPDDRLGLIAEYLDLSVGFLMTGEDKEDTLSDEYAHLVVKIRKDIELSKALLKYFELSDVQKKHVIDTINMLSEVQP